MRNIIGWSRPDDRTFPTRLASRAVKVTAPLVRRNERDAERTQLVTAFDRLSQERKRDRLIATARAHFEKLGYAVTDLRQVHGDRPHVSHELRSGLTAIEQRGQKFRFVFFHVVPSLTARVLGAYRYEVIFDPLYTFLRLLQPPRKMPKDIDEDVIVCSMQTGSLRRLRSDFAMLHVGETDGTLQCDREFPSHGEGPKAMRHLTFHILDTSTKLATFPAFLTERFTRRPR
jgi:hypothetical protein